MGKRITGKSSLTIGLDIGDKHTVGCVLSSEGEILETFRMATTPSAVKRTMEGFEPSRVVLEVGTHSPWMSRGVEAAGHELIIANPRRVRRIAENDAKTDEVDAELLARLARVDPELLKPIVHRGEEAQRDRVLLLARDGLVRSRTQLINQVRGFAKSLGQRMPTSSTEAFPRRVRERFPDEVFPGQSAMLGLIERLNEEIAAMDREAERLCRERYPETGVMRQVKGVGALTSLAFVLTVEDPERGWKRGQDSRAETNRWRERWIHGTRRLDGAGILMEGLAADNEQLASIGRGSILAASFAASALTVSAVRRS